MSGESANQYSFGEFVLDANLRTLKRGGETVALSSKAFDVLLVLVRNRGRVFSRNEILDLVWENQFVEENNLSVQMSALRKALGEQRAQPKFLVTIPGKGYKFVGDVQTGTQNLSFEKHRVVRLVVEEETEIHRSDDGVGTQPLELPPKPSRSNGVLVLAAVAIVAALLLAGFTFLPKRGEKNDPWLQSFLTDPKLKQVTTRGSISWATISPDGKLFAYSSNERGEFAASLWVAPIEGTNEIQLRPPSGQYQGIVFTPDSKTLYFTVTGAPPAQNGLFRMPALGGVVEKISDRILTSFAISPDAKQVVYTRTDKENSTSVLVVANLDGSGESEIASRPIDIPFHVRPTWSTDGSMIAVQALNDPGKEGRDIYVVRLDDGSVQRLTTLDWNTIHNLAWRPDSKGLIAVATDRNESLRHLWHIDFPADEVRRLSNDTDSYGSAISISDSGDALMAVQLKREGNIWVAPARDLSAARQITFSSINGVYGWHGFDWAPNGTIVFCAGVDRTFSIYSMASDGTAVTQITAAGFSDQRPKVSGDGKYIVFQSNRTGASEIWRVGIDGTDLRQLTSGGGNSAPDTTPDGQWVIFLSARDGRNQLRRIPIEGGEESLLADNVSWGDPTVSPDGDLIAFTRVQEGKLQVSILPVADGEALKSFDLPRSTHINQSLTWTADGKAICFRDAANGIWRQSLEGGDPQRLEGIPEEKIYKFAWSHDGSSFAFARGREISDAIVINAGGK